MRKVRPEFVMLLVQRPFAARQGKGRVLLRTSVRVVAVHLDEHFFTP